MKDMGAGKVQHTPGSKTMDFYREVQSSAGYDERGNPKNVGKQSAYLGGAGSAPICDPTEKMGKYEGGSVANSKSPNAKVSKKLAKPHKLVKGKSVGKVN